MTRIPSLPRHGLAHALGLTALLLSAAFAQTARASDHDAENQSSATASAAANRYTTRAGDTLERIAQQQFRDSPLQQVVVVKVLQEHNQLLIGDVRPRQRLKTGLVLELPSHEQLARKVLMTYLQAEQAQQPSTSSP